jgi:hypothetical protein
MGDDLAQKLEIAHVAVTLRFLELATEFVLVHAVDAVQFDYLLFFGQPHVFSQNIHSDVETFFETL